MVTEVRVPQAELLHPVPASDPLMIALGFEPVTGLGVATITAVADVLTVPGAASCSVKWLVMATVWLASKDRRQELPLSFQRTVVSG